MKKIDCILIPLAIITILCASLGLYYGAPDPNQTIKCSDLILADQPGSEYPLLAQGVILTTGAIFVIVVMSIGEWNSKNLKGSSRKKKCRHLLRSLTVILVGFCIVVGLSMVTLRSKDLSPSFVDSCKPNPPVSLLCPNVSSQAKVNDSPTAEINVSSKPKLNDTSKAGVNVTCTTYSIKWIPALSENYPRMIVVQTYLMISLFIWTILWWKESTNRSGVTAIFIGVISTALLIGIGFAAWLNNESLGMSVLCEYLIGIGLTIISWLILSLVKLGAEKYDRENDHPLPFTVPKQTLSNPEPLPLGALGKSKPIPNPIYPDLSEPIDKTKLPSNPFSGTFPSRPKF